MKDVRWNKSVRPASITTTSTTTVIIRPKRSTASSELWKYSTGQKTVFTRSAINSAESEPIWMKFGLWITVSLSAHCWENFGVFGRFRGRSAQ